MVSGNVLDLIGQGLSREFFTIKFHLGSQGNMSTLLFTFFTLHAIKYLMVLLLDNTFRLNAVMCFIFLLI